MEYASTESISGHVCSAVLMYLTSINDRITALSIDDRATRHTEHYIPARLDLKGIIYHSIGDHEDRCL